MDTIKCDVCKKDKPENQVKLMMVGAGIPVAKNAKEIEYRIRKWAELVTGKTFYLFPYICNDCQSTESYKAMRRRAS